MFNNSMTFDLGDDVNALRETVNKWAQARLRPIAVKIDKDCLLYTSDAADE